MAPISGTATLMAAQRGWGEDGIFFEHTAHCRDRQGRWRGVVSLGFGPDGKRIRRHVSGNTRAVVQDRLRALHGDLDAGVKARPDYTLRRAAEDWLREGPDGRSAKAIKKNENVLAPILTAIGARRLRELTAADVHQALTAMAARYSTAAVAMGHNAAVWRSVRSHGDTKTDKSRRTLALPRMAPDALRVTRPSRPPTGTHPEHFRASTISFSPPGQEHLWTRPTSGASSGPCARPRSIGQNWTRTNCAAPSSP
jgi:hypothetical protein